MSVGAVVWVAIGTVWVLSLLAGRLVGPIPGISAVVRAFLGSWFGRMVALAAWAEAGWHLFGQRP